jgi:hypothetical protein
LLSKPYQIRLLEVFIQKIKLHGEGYIYVERLVRLSSFGKRTAVIEKGFGTCCKLGPWVVD